MEAGGFGYKGRYACSLTPTGSAWHRAPWVKDPSRQLPRCRGAAASLTADAHAALPKGRAGRKDEQGDVTLDLR